MRVLLVEDDNFIRKIQKGLMLEYTNDIEEASSYEEAIKIVKNQNINLIILDIELDGEKTGLDFLREIRKSLDTYVIVISKMEEDLEAYDLGADDYMRKPYNSEVLKRKIEVFLKRFKVEAKTLKFDENLYLDNEKMLVFYKNEEVRMGRKEFELLNFLILNKGIVLSKDTLYEHIWGDDGETRKLETLISRLKTKVPYLREKIISQAKYGYVMK